MGDNLIKQISFALFLSALLLLLSSCGNDFEIKEPAVITDDIDMSNYVFVGDMLVEKDQIIDHGDEVSTQAARYNLWDINRRLWWKGKGIVPYQFHSSASSKLKTMFKQAAKKWSDGTGIRFVPRNGHKYYVLVRADQSGCWANFGRPINPGYSNLNIAPGGCTKVGIIMHEIGHILGLIHEHQRDDRDKYITVNWGNMKSSDRGAFNIMAKDTYHWSKYDFESIMHYGHFNFSSNGAKTITTKPAFRQYEGKLGDPVLKTEKLSWADKAMIKKWYQLN